MVYNPRQQSEIYQSLEDRLRNRISSLTNFAETSFNYTWTQAYASRFRDAEVAQLAVQLSGWVDYAGGPIDQTDLDALGVDGVDAEQVNQYMEDEDLDNIAALVGVSRDEGDRATGQVTFTTSSSATSIPSGTQVGTQPDADGDFFAFTTDNDVSTSAGQTTVTVDITAEAVGTEYNVGSGQITYFVSPPTGVQSVTNNQATSGGIDRESNESLRERVKDAIFNKSGGGTAAGVEGYVRSNTENAQSVSVKEYPGGNQSTGAEYEGPGGPGGSSSDTPFVDVIVEGGTQQDALDAIDQSKPVGVHHNLVRPTFISVSIDMELSGTNIDTQSVEDTVQNYISALGLNETVVRDKIIQRIMNTDNDIEGINTLTVSVTEDITFQSGTDVYELRKGSAMESDDADGEGITEVTGIAGGSSTTFTEDTDYQEWNTSAGNNTPPHNAIDWSLGGTDPDDGTNFTVDYNIDDDIPIDEYEKSEVASVTATVV